MKKVKLWGAAIIIGLIIGLAALWTISKFHDLNEPINKYDAFVYSDRGMIYFFELRSKGRTIEGKLHQQRLWETSGNTPFIEENLYALSGQKTEKGYRFKVKKDSGSVEYNAWFSGPHLSVQKEGEKDFTLYNPVDQEELETYIQALRDYHVEENEKKQRREFFTKLRNVYGYLYSVPDSPFQLFIKIDEALLQGEVSGSLLLMDDEGNETKYALNGITDGKILELYTTVNGKETKLKGKFQEGAARFQLSFWMTDQKLTFQAVNEKEYKQKYESFKKK